MFLLSKETKTKHGLYLPLKTEQVSGLSFVLSEVFQELMTDFYRKVHSFF